MKIELMFLFIASTAQVAHAEERVTQLVHESIADLMADPHRIRDKSGEVLTVMRSGRLESAVDDDGACPEVERLTSLCEELD